MIRHLGWVLALSVATAVSASAGQNAAGGARAAASRVRTLAQAYIQLDWRAYPESPVTPGTGRLAFNTFEFRRLRAGVNGQWRGVRFELTLDPQDVDGTLVKDAYAEFRPGSYRIRVGQFKPPGSREYGTSARQTDFLERAALGRALSAQRDVGVALHGDLGRRIRL